MKKQPLLMRILVALAMTSLALSACTSVQPATDAAGSSLPSASGAVESTSETTVIADLAPIDLAEPLRVVATTSIIGDVAQQVGGDAIDLAVLLPAGSDPHTWTPTPQDLVTLSDADLVLINGVGLEEGLIPILSTISGPQIVSVNEGVPIYQAEDDHDHDDDDDDEAHEHEDEHDSDTEAADHAHEEGAHSHDEGDPHTWQDVANVRIWAENIANAFSTLDPAHKEQYVANADAYRAQLSALADEIAAMMEGIPQSDRKLVTDHDDLGYFARAYGFSVEGTIIPSISAMASVSAQSMAALQEQIIAEGVHSIFVGNTVNRDLANQIAADTGVQVIPLYTDALGAAESPAATYIDMMRYNANAIVEALAP